MAIQVDIAILGGGIGGYTAAIRAAQLGKTVAIVEMDKLGGTCLHKGCIPSKALLRSAEVYATLLESSSYGIDVADGAISLDYSKVQKRKDATVEQLHRGLQGLMKKNGIQIIHGKARVIGPSIFSPRSGSLAVELPDGEMESVVSTNLIIATGSAPRSLPGLTPDGQYIWTSDHALAMDSLPASILIVGGGVIGVEWASMLQDFGVQVTLVEAGSRLIPGEDAEISAELTKLLRRRGVRVLTGIQLNTSHTYPYLIRIRMRLARKAFRCLRAPRTAMCCCRRRSCCYRSDASRMPSGSDWRIPIFGRMRAAQLR
jgi:dihydrolipoamide dehydrogenase